MAENWLFRNAILENTTSPVDIAVRLGRIAGIGPGLDANGCQVVDAQWHAGLPALH